MNEVSDPECHWVVGCLIGAASVVEKRLDRAVEEASGLSLAQLDFLDHVERCGGTLPLGKVAERLCCVRSNVTQLADRLETQGWIRRDPDPEDRRSVQAVLTAEGRRRLERGKAARAKVEREIAEAAGDGGFARTLERIHERFE